MLDCVLLVKGQGAQFCIKNARKGMSKTTPYSLEEWTIFIPLYFICVLSMKCNYYIVPSKFTQWNEKHYVLGTYSTFCKKYQMQCNT